LQKIKYKNIIIDSLKFLVLNKRVLIYGFVLMPNHIHIIWQMQPGNKPSDVQRDFFKFTSQQMKFDLQKNYPKVLEHFKVNLKDRKYQVLGTQTIINSTLVRESKGIGNFTGRLLLLKCKVLYLK